MSNLKLKTASNGSVTLTPQDTASDVVLTVPAGTSTMVTNATLPTQLNASGSAPIYACRAWVNFNGEGTVAIRASGNVTSITDNGTGDYTVNFTTAMPDKNYAVAGLMMPSVSNNGSDTFALFATSNASLVNLRHYEAGVLRDSGWVSLIVFR